MASSPLPTPDAIQGFEELLARSSWSLDTLDVQRAVASLSAFHDAVKFEDLADYGGEEDMLIGEWGDLGLTGALEAHFVRQLILASGAILQLQLKLSFTSATLRSGSTDWQLTAEGFQEAGKRMVTQIPEHPTSVALGKDWM